MERTIAVSTTNGSSGPATDPPLFGSFAIISPGLAATTARMPSASNYHQQPRTRAGTAHSLDEAELAWWTQYGDVEEEYCWVQTAQIQRLLRGHYLRRIARAIPPGSRVLEIGCGSGWLSLLLARYGASQVHGVDLSPEQIERARAAAAASEVGQRVSFSCGTAPSTDLPADAAPGRYEALVAHGVLHHLSDDEIHALLRTFSTRWASPEAQVFLVEPVQYRSAGAERTRLDAWVDRLIHLPRAGARVGLRRFSPEEAALTARIDSRGDSPKEAPFRPGELETLLEPYLQVVRKTPVLNFSYLGAKNALLMRLSHPRRAERLLVPYLLSLRVLERLILRLSPGATWLPLFVLYECRLRPRN